MNPCLNYRHCSQAAWLVTSLLLSFGILPTSSLAQGTSAPQLIPFQGRLTNQAGVAYDNGQYTITLNLYSLAIGGSTVWTERHEKVSVIGGMLNLFLGSISPFDKSTPSLTDDVDFSTTKYLGITVDADNNPTTADPEMVPRTMIVTAFYAKNTQKLAGNDWSAFVTDSGGSPSNDPATGYLNAAKILPASITVNQIKDSAITTGKIADRQITAEKLAITEVLTPGSIIMHHTYNGATSIPRGWLTCDGTLISQARYESEHGSGSYLSDGISQSILLNKYLPNFEGKYAVGSAATTAVGNSPIGVVGNIGNQISLSHTHSIPAHRHQWIAQNGNGYAMLSWNGAGNLVTLNSGQPNTGNRIQLNTAGNGIGATSGVDVNYYTSVDGGGNTGDSSQTSKNIQPESIQVKYIMKIK